MHRLPALVLSKELTIYSGNYCNIYVMALASRQEEAELLFGGKVQVLISIGVVLDFNKSLVVGY